MSHWLPTIPVPAYPLPRWTAGASSRKAAAQRRRAWALRIVFGVPAGMVLLYLAAWLAWGGL